MPRPHIMAHMSRDELAATKELLTSAPDFKITAALALRFIATIEKQAEALRKANETLAEARDVIIGVTAAAMSLDEHWTEREVTKADEWLNRHPAPTGDLDNAK